jgi:uncharacterized membrane protein YgcG
VRKSPLIAAGIPTASIVYRVVDGKAVATPVVTGASNLTDTVIVDGLKEGEMVVTGPYKSLETLKDGDAVRNDEGGGSGWGGGWGSGGGGGGGRGGGGRGGMRMRF